MRCPTSRSFLLLVAMPGAPSSILLDGKMFYFCLAVMSQGICMMGARLGSMVELGLAPKNSIQSVLFEMDFGILLRNGVRRFAFFL